MRVSEKQDLRLQRRWPVVLFANYFQPSSHDEIALLVLFGDGGVKWLVLDKEQYAVKHVQ